MNTLFENNNRGFTLIEMALVVLILGILASIALPGYADYTEKARLTDLQLRVDAMRTAMATAYETGDRSMFSAGAGKPGEIPASMSNIPISDSMTYPGMTMLLMSSDQQFGQFAAGTIRPYLVLGISGSDPAEARTLRNFSEIYPASRQAWWVPSTIMVIPLLDDGMLGVARPAVTTTAPPATGTTVSGAGSTDSGSVGAQTANTPPPAETVPTPVDPPVRTVPSPTVNPPVVATTTTCVHPGNGHAWGHCGGKP